MRSRPVYSTSQVEYSKRVDIYYRSMGKKATYSLVVSNEVLKEEIAACFVFINDWVETTLLGKPDGEYLPPD